jgi:hypothetical protein
MKTTIDMAREAGGDDWGLFKDFMPEIERLVALVRADEREQALAAQPAPVPLTDEQFQAIRGSLSRQDGWDGDGWDFALKEAIEAAHGITKGQP